MRTPAFPITAVCLIIGCALLLPSTEPFLGYIPSVVILFGPLVLNLIGARLWRSPPAQVVLSISSVAYIIGLGRLYYDIYRDFTSVHTDPQGPVAFGFVGVVALVLWNAARIAEQAINRRGRNGSATDSTNEPIV